MILRLALVTKTPSKARKSGRRTEHETLIGLHGEVATILVTHHWGVDPCLL
jgi:hypothetical protein